MLKISDGFGGALAPATIGLATALLGASLLLTPARADQISSQFSPATAAGATADHSAWSALLKTYVKPDSSGLNRVDYKSFKAGGHSGLKSYIKGLEATKVSGLNRDAQFAFWANLYNAVTVDVILDHYPVSSIKKIKFGKFFASGPWGKKLVTVNGVKLSLDDIEHKILRGLFKDNRVHYAVNCASVGCPNLAVQAFAGATLDSQLDAGAQAYVNHPRGVSIARGRATVSSIYKWFKKDFGSSDKNVLAHLRKYAAAPLKAKLAGISSIYDYEYDWSLNDSK